MSALFNYYCMLFFSFLTIILYCKFLFCLDLVVVGPHQLYRCTRSKPTYQINVCQIKLVSKSYMLLIYKLRTMGIF